MDDKQNHFQIYGRTSYEQPLSFVATLSAKGDAAAETLAAETLAAAALAAAGEAAWVELVAIPTAAFLHVMGKKDDD